MLAYLFVVFAIAVRFLPHPMAFTPVTAALLFFGARGSRRQIWVPLALLAVSDVILTKAVYAYPTFSWDHYVTWAWYAAMLFLGTRLGTTLKPLRVIGAALAGSVSFFLLSNFAVWAAMGMYPKNWNGLMMSYVAGLPFFRRGVEGDLLFTVAMFATPVALHALAKLVQKDSDHVAAA
jgi:hypothetical protein